MNMRILDRYILNEFLKVFFLTTAAFITLDVLVEFLDKADMLFKHGSGLSEAAQFFLYQVPFIFYQTVPVSILLATLVSLGTLSRHNEITAVKSNGISVLKIITPILLFSVLITGVSIMLNEYCLPLTNRRVERIRREKVEGKPKSSNYGQGRVWYRGDNNIFTVLRMEPKKGVLNGVTVYELDRDFNLIGRTDAGTVRWNGNKWMAERGTMKRFNKADITEAAPIDGKEVKGLLDNPGEFERPEALVETMSITDIRDYARKLGAEGYDATRYLVDYHSKIAFPFVNMVMALLGIPFALKTGRHGGITAGIGISVAIAFSYWIIFAVSSALGQSGVLPPFIAAWMTNLILGLFGVFLFTYVRQ